MDMTLYKNYQRITVQEAPGKVGGFDWLLID